MITPPKRKCFRESFQIRCFDFNAHFTGIFERCSFTKLAEMSFSPKSGASTDMQCAPSWNGGATTSSAPPVTATGNSNKVFSYYREHVNSALETDTEFNIF